MASTKLEMVERAEAEAAAAAEAEAEAMLPPGVGAGVAPKAGGGSRTRQYVAALAASMSAMATGAALAWTSPALPALKAEEGSPLGRPLGEAEGAWVGALLAVGALAGALPAARLADRLGRRRALAALALPYLLSSAALLLSSGPAGLYLARLLAGVATGAACVLAPLYVGEVAEAAVRGALGSAFQLLVTVGILYVYAAGALLSYTGLTLACAAPPVLLLAGMLLCAPESPAFLVRAGREDEARSELRLLRGAGGDVEGPMAELRAAAAAAAAEAEAARAEGGGGGGLGELVASPARRRALLLMMGLMLFQQLSGINAVIFYLQDIFQGAGSGLAPDAAACLAGGVQVLATLAATLLVDRAGRRPLLLLSAGVMALCLVTLGFCFKFPSLPGALSLLAVGLYLVVFSLGFGPLPYMMMGELFDPEVKGTASGLAVALNWLIVFGVTFAFGPASEAVGGHAVFWFFALVIGGGGAFVLLLLPETKGKTLPEIQQALAAGRRR